MPSDVTSAIFFKMNMKPGKRMELYFEKAPPSSARLLPREQAYSIPFSSQHLPYFLNLFSLPQGSPEALTVEENPARVRDSSEQRRDQSLLEASMESMLNFSRSVLSEPTLLTGTLLGGDQKSVYQNYTALRAPKEVLTSEMVAYQYVIFYYHTQKGRNKVYKIPFVAETLRVLEISFVVDLILRLCDM